MRYVMKKFISIILLFSSVLFMLCSCGNYGNNISSVSIDNISKTYKTVYLYSFKDASIDDYYQDDSSDMPPTATGYVYSTEKLKVGDKIEVWSNLWFGNLNSYPYGNSRRGTNAVVSRIVATYRVTVEEKEDTYIITYYTISESSSASKRKDLKELTKHKIEVTKERVIINYDV